MPTPAGAVTTTSVSLADTTGAATPPNVTVGADPKFTPLKSTSFPPAAGPWSGLSALTNGTAPVD